MNDYPRCGIDSRYSEAYTLRTLPRKEFRRLLDTGNEPAFLAFISIGPCEPKVLHIVV